MSNEGPKARAATADTPTTAAEIVASIRTGQVLAESVMRAALARADALERLNALIFVNRDAALAAARKVDADRAAGHALPPLAGLPIVVKDNINTADMPTTAGTPALQHARPRTTAPSLQKLLDAGAIVLGKANLHELAFGITSTNLSPFAGPVRNPYDETRIPGGSSGGTAAAIAAVIVTCGLGTDTGGSTRVPAALTGTVGLRPSVGNGGAERRYHNENAVVPISHTRDTVGPMGRTVEDVALLDSIMTGTPAAEPVTLKGVRLGMPATLWAGLAKDTATVAKAARDKLAAAGVVLVDADLPDVFGLNEKVSMIVALHEPLDDFAAYLEASGIDGVTLADIAGTVASPDVKGACGAIIADAFGAQYGNAIETERPKLQKLYADYFRQNDLAGMLFPTTIAPAVPIDAAAGSAQVSIDGGPPVDTFGTFIRNTDPGSNAGIPGLSLFAGMTAGGLPIGLAIDGPVGSDRTLLAIGLAMEKLLGHAPPPKL